jgi:hypothetical protein
VPPRTPSSPPLRVPGRDRGLFKSFLDVLDDDADSQTGRARRDGGSSRHALVVDERRCAPVPICAPSPCDFCVRRSGGQGDGELGERVRRAATELAVVVRGQIEQGIADRAWSTISTTSQATRSAPSRQPQTSISIRR